MFTLGGARTLHGLKFASTARRTGKTGLLNTQKIGPTSQWSSPWRTREPDYPASYREEEMRYLRDDPGLTFDTGPRRPKHQCLPEQAPGNAFSGTRVVAKHLRDRRPAEGDVVAVRGEVVGFFPKRAPEGADYWLIRMPDGEETRIWEGDDALAPWTEPSLFLSALRGDHDYGL